MAPLSHLAGSSLDSTALMSGWFLFQKTAWTVRAIPGCQLLGEAYRWFGTAVGVANERPEEAVSMMVVEDMIPHSECE